MTDYRAGGYAHFPGSYAGPARVGLTCAGCRFASHVSTKYRTDHFCDKASALAKSGRRARIELGAPACKYWEEKQ